MSLKQQNMIKWMKDNTKFHDAGISLIVARAFKHDTEQMQNERTLIQEAIQYKRKFEEIVNNGK